MTCGMVRAIALTTTLCVLPGIAMAQDYVTLENSAFPGDLMTGNTAAQAGAVWMGPDAQASTGQHWYAQEVSEDTFRIKLGSSPGDTCLTLVAHDVLQAVAAIAPCAEDGAQLWTSSDTDPMRIYNRSLPRNSCLTAINSGTYTGSLTMTECGTGDVSTELWIDRDVAN